MQETTASADDFSIEPRVKKDSVNLTQPAFSESRSDF